MLKERIVELECAILDEGYDPTDSELYCAITNLLELL